MRLKALAELPKATQSGFLSLKTAMNPVGPALEEASKARLEMLKTKLGNYTTVKPPPGEIIVFVGMIWWMAILAWAVNYGYWFSGCIWVLEVLLISVL